VPLQVPDIGQRAKQVVWNQLMTPIKTEMLDDLRWYFEQARAHPAPSRCPDLDKRFYRARDAFSAPRFTALYRVWKQDGLAEIAPSIVDDPRVCLLHFSSDVTTERPLFDYQLRKGISAQRLGMTLLKQEGVLELLDRSPVEAGR
jgi:hypothetical protein